jgi:sec-independent protein translocase protein TatA
MIKAMNPILAFSMPGIGELVVILLIILVLFGASRIPEIARSMGKGISEFKKALTHDSDDSKSGSKDKTDS